MPIFFPQVATNTIQSSKNEKLNAKKTAQKNHPKFGVSPTSVSDALVRTTASSSKCEGIPTTRAVKRPYEVLQEDNELSAHEKAYKYFQKNKISFLNSENLQALKMAHPHDAEIKVVSLSKALKWLIDPAQSPPKKKKRQEAPKAIVQPSSKAPIEAAIREVVPALALSSKNLEPYSDESFMGELIGTGNLEQDYKALERWTNIWNAHPKQPVKSTPSVAGSSTTTSPSDLNDPSSHKKHKSRVAQERSPENVKTSAELPNDTAGSPKSPFTELLSIAMPNSSLQTPLLDSYECPAWLSSLTDEDIRKQPWYRQDLGKD